MAILTRKKAEVQVSMDDFNSPVLNKVMEFHAKNARLSVETEKNKERVGVLAAQLEEARGKYADSYSDEDLKELIAVESELNTLNNVLKAQQDIARKGIKREYILSEDEQKSLTKSFAPIRKHRDDLVQKLHSQLAEVEKTLEELGEEQDRVHEIWSKVFGPIHAASSENWVSGVTLNKQTATVEAKTKLNALAYHKGLNVHLWHI